MDTIQSAIRDLAVQAGNPGITDEQVKILARKASEQYMDGILDQGDKQ